jgi:hypothetical protein
MFSTGPRVAHERFRVGMPHLPARVQRADPVPEALAGFGSLDLNE